MRGWNRYTGERSVYWLSRLDRPPCVLTMSVIRLLSDIDQVGTLNDKAAVIEKHYRQNRDHNLPYGEGKAVYVKGKGNGKQKLYIEEAKNGIYILRRNVLGAR